MAAMCLNKKSNQIENPLNVTGFGKNDHFVTFDTSNIYGQNSPLYSTSQPFSDYKVCTLNYQKTFEIF